MKKYNYIASAKRTLKIESESIQSISNQLDSSFVELCDKVLNCDGKFVIMGVGKSGHVAQKISATLSSTGTPSIFIHPTEAAHGDMGLINKKDINTYFPRDFWVKHATEALDVTETNKDFDINVSVLGGGLTGQSGAIRLGISRIICNSFDGQ